METILERLLRQRRDSTKHYDASMEKIFKNVEQDTNVSKDQIVTVLNIVWETVHLEMIHSNLNEGATPNDFYIPGFGKILHSENKRKKYIERRRIKEDGQTI